MTDYPMSYDQAEKLVTLIDYYPSFNEEAGLAADDPEVAAYMRDEIDFWPGWMMPILQEAIRVVNAGPDKPRVAPPPFPKTVEELYARRLPPFV